MAAYRAAVFVRTETCRKRVKTDWVAGCSPTRRPNFCGVDAFGSVIHCLRRNPRSGDASGQALTEIVSALPVADGADDRRTGDHRCETLRHRFLLRLGD